MPLSAAPLGPVRILLVEDSPEDAELISLQLVDAGLEAVFVRVDSEGELRQALVGDAFDLVLSDLDLPGFSGHQALTLLRQHDPVLPFIFVSGTIGEDTAVMALQQGANDYVLKHNTVRLPAAAARAIREARNERERERAENELMRSQRLNALAMLAAGLSHDLRNILQPMLIVPDLLETYSDDPKILKLGALIAESGRRGHEMAESMLSFVRGSRKQSETIKLAALFQAVQLLLQGSLPRSIKLDVDMPAEDVTVQGNFTELQQCLINLCLNGIQAMEGREGKLALSAQRQGDKVVVQVSDQGVGMSAQMQAQLFTPFFTTKRNGTGLGLMSCKRIVDAMHGRIEVDSDAERGTRFTLHLPVRPPTVDEPASETFLEGRGQRILLVDGDTTRLSLLATAVGSQGYEPWVASDGAMALRLLATDGQPDLVIVDSDILLLSAVSLLLALREAGFQGPVVSLEDPLHPLSHHDLPSGTISAVVHKPLQMTEILRTVERTLARAAH
ncbi:sensor histidine kinase [Pseudoxanthomonas indica]|uniref:histidine kinase n=1 Tax=Pseudoxanthomonas indica TaxID=428993 RepID=A0A1T5LAC8_9GAMM|nr:ATP-binding protein [Pseudoxanthomonas indica]GGD32346.1 hybrid sensor histidine kinase/response regulator [Pseudoxanthomonas indica]SKC72645.1 Response regulator receiver domain-containing protein [Pseudoxanthomonas indica]